MTSPLPLLSELLSWPPGQAPWAAQEAAHQLSANERIFALLAEQRTGKTIVTFGTSAWQYRRFLEAGGFGPSKLSPRQTVRDLLPKKFVHGKDGALAHTKIAGRFADLPKAPKPEFIYRPAHWATRGLDALLVVAMPSGIPGNWAREAAVRIPPALNAKTFVWNASKSGLASYAAEFIEFLSHEGLVLFAVNGEAIATADARKAIGTFLRARRALAVGDETSLICSRPGNIRSKAMVAIRGLPGAVARRILDGTPADEDPLDVFSQTEFLKSGALGFPTWTAFKNFVAEWETVEIWCKDKKTGKAVARPVLQQKTDDDGKKVFCNLDEIARRLAAFSFRVKRSDCFDIPAKVFTPYRFELSAAQCAVYDPLREEFEAELRTGKKVSAANVLARMTRLDQVASGYWPGEKVPAICEPCGGDGCDACDGVGAILFMTAKTVIDPERNSRLDALADVLSINKEPGIVWCRFSETVDGVLALGEKLKRNPVRYDGLVDDEWKAIALKEFSEGRSGLFVAKEASAGRGLDLRAAAWMAYAENGWSRRARSQSEDRAEVIGRTHGTGIIDLIAIDTYDDRKLEAHRTKGERSNLIMDVIMGAGRQAA